MADPALNILDIAAGTGALSEAIRTVLARLGCRSDIVCGIERDATAAAAFVARVENETGRIPAVWDDARTFVTRRYRCPGSGSGIDIICGGYPCQPFTQAGKRAGAKDSRHLWPSCRRIVARIKPSLVFFENVSGHVSLGLSKVLKDLERLGYRTAPGLFTAEEVGAPHRRERVFVLGVQDAETRKSAGELANTIGQRSQGRKSALRAAGDTGEFAERGGTLAFEQWLAGGPRPLFPPPRRVDLAEVAKNLTKSWLLESRQSLVDAACRGILRMYRDWEIVAEMDPTLMPAIESGVSVVADGVASSSDLFRLGGNGVVRQAAAVALMMLLAHAHCPPRRSHGNSDKLKL